MTSLSKSMAENELSNPNSMYYVGGPTVMDEIRNYMGGGSYGLRYPNYMNYKRNMYIGQPVVDQYESLAKTKFSRQSENLFKAVAAGGTALIVGLAARKIPGVKPLVKFGGKLLGLAWAAVKLPFKLLWKAIK